MVEKAKEPTGPPGGHSGVSAYQPNTPKSEMEKRTTFARYQAKYGNISPGVNPHLRLKETQKRNTDIIIIT